MNEAALRARIRARLDLIESDRYSVMEMASDLERLANHPVWEASDRDTALLEKLTEQIDELRAAVLPVLSAYRSTTAVITEDQITAAWAAYDRTEGTR